MCLKCTEKRLPEITFGQPLVNSIFFVWYSLIIIYNIIELTQKGTNLCTLFVRIIGSFYLCLVSEKNICNLIWCFFIGFFHQLSVDVMSCADLLVTKSFGNRYDIYTGCIKDGCLWASEFMWVNTHAQPLREWEHPFIQCIWAHNRSGFLYEQISIRIIFLQFLLPLKIISDAGKTNSSFMALMFFIFLQQWYEFRCNIYWPAFIVFRCVMDQSVFFGVYNIIFNSDGTVFQLDGQIKDIEEPFEVAGKKAMFPWDFGDPAEDCNCRCALLQKSEWLLDEDETKYLAMSIIWRMENFSRWQINYISLWRNCDHIVARLFRFGQRVMKILKGSIIWFGIMKEVELQRAVYKRRSDKK